MTEKPSFKEAFTMPSAKVIADVFAELALSTIAEGGIADMGGNATTPVALQLKMHLVAQDHDDVPSHGPGAHFRELAARGESNRPL